jgi:hypothetical protein
LPATFPNNFAIFEVVAACTIHTVDNDLGLAIVLKNKRGVPSRLFVHYLGTLIDGRKELELMAPIGLDIVCFRYNPGGLDGEALNALNKGLLIQLQESGIAAPSYTTLGENYCLRVAISNHRSRFADFDTLVDAVMEIGGSLSQG